MVASLGTPYRRMMLHGWVFAIQSLGLGHILVDELRIFAMRHDGQRRVFKDVFKRFEPVNKHVSRAGTHKKLNARHAFGV